jgi:lipocalin
MPDLEDDDK